MLGYLIRVAKPGHEGNEGRHPTSKDGGTVIMGLSLMQYGGPVLHLLNDGAVIKVPVLVVQHIEHEHLVNVVVGGLVEHGLHVHVVVGGLAESELVVCLRGLHLVRHLTHVYQISCEARSALYLLVYIYIHIYIYIYYI
jgi:hypothetical protein